MDAQEAQTLYDAIVRDVAAGHFGKNQFYNARVREETYANELVLYYISTDLSESDTGSFSLTLSVYCTETLAALEQLGLVSEEYPLITYAQRDAAQEAEGADEYETSAYSDGAIYPELAF